MGSETESFPRLQDRVEHDRAQQNLLVGKAAGLDVSIFDFAADGPRCVIDNRRVFEPWTDANAALEAADKAGLFKALGYSLSYGYPERGIHAEKCWFIEMPHRADGWEDEIGEGSTPQEAICNAILNLHGKDSP